MKRILLASLLSAFVAAPLIACDYEKTSTKDTKASLSTEKKSTKVAKAKKALKTVAAAPTNKEKI